MAKNTRTIEVPADKFVLTVELDREDVMALLEHNTTRGFTILTTKEYKRLMAQGVNDED